MRSKSAGTRHPKPPATILQMGHAVCVYCSSSDAVAPRLRALAGDVGQGLAARGWILVYGGGGVGLMGEVARAALEGGAHVTGVIPDKLVDREFVLPGLTEVVRTRSLRERKQIMDDRSDAFLILPGGIGTLEELVEMLALRQLGEHDRPIVALDADGFWEPLRAQFRHMAEQNMLHRPMDRLWAYAKTVDEALDTLERQTPRRTG